MRRQTMYLLVIVLAAVLGYAGGVEAQFDESSVQGDYGLSGQGQLAGAPASLVGFENFDGAGGCTVQATLSTLILPATFIPLTSSQCTYTVNANGTGTSNIVFAAPPGAPGPLSFTSSFVIVNGGNDLLFIVRDNFGGGTNASGTARKQ